MKMATRKNEYKIAVIPGDGVGAEVSKEAMRIASKSAEKSHAHLSAEWFDWGCDYYLKHGMMMPQEALEVLRVVGYGRRGVGFHLEMLRIGGEEVVRTHISPYICSSRQVS